MLSTVPREIALAITVKIKMACHDPAGYRPLPDSGVDHFALPCNVACEADVDGDKRMHHAPTFRREFPTTSFCPENGDMAIPSLHALGRLLCLGGILGNMGITRTAEMQSSLRCASHSTWRISIRPIDYFSPFGVTSLSSPVDKS